MNIFVDQRLSSVASVTDWAGPDAILRNVSIRLGAPNYPGDTMVMTGEVKGKDDADNTVEGRDPRARTISVTTSPGP